MDQLKEYIAAYSKASDRTRSIYLIILAFSTVCLAAFLNSAEFGWNKTRLDRTKLAYAYLCQHNAEKKKDLIASLTPQERDVAIKYIKTKNLKTIEEAKALFNDAQKRVADASAVQIPLFGLSFHVNDIGLVAGLSMFLLLLLLKYALTREIANLQLAVDKARQAEQLRYAYEILSSSEVLHRPPDLNVKPYSRIIRPIIDAPVAMLFLPVICYGVVMANDCRTVGYGLLFSESYTRFIVAFEIIAFASLIAIAWSCFKIVHATRAIWADLHDEANRGPLGTENLPA